MTKKDYLELIFFIICTFLTLIVADLLGITNTGLSKYDSCVVGKLDEFVGLGFINLLAVYGLYFRIGILPFAWSFCIWSLITQFFFKDFYLKIFKPNKQVKELSTIHNILLASIYVPLPIFLYDIVYC